MCGVRWRPLLRPSTPWGKVKALKLMVIGNDCAAAPERKPK